MQTTARAGIVRATLTASPNTDAAQLERLRMQLGAEGFSTLMDTVNGRATLEIRGVKNANILLESLAKTGAIQGDETKEYTVDHSKPVSFGKRVRGKAFYFSSLFYNLGNVAYIISGIQRGRHNKDGKITSHDVSETMIGAAFSVGDIFMTAYGHDKGDEELQAADQGLRRYLRQKGIQIPQGDTLNPDLLHQSGVVKATHRWMHKHIGRIKCLTEFTGGLLTIHAALNPHNRNQGKLVAGCLIAVGWLATFVLDKPRGHHIFTKHKSHKGVMETVLDNPRAWIASPLAMANNIANLKGSYDERKRYLQDITSAQNPADRVWAERKQYDYLWNVTSACSFLVAHSLFGLSGTRHPYTTEDDKAVMEDLILLSANTLAKQPEKIRAAAVDETAQYVSRLAHVTLDKDDIAKAINDKIAALSHSNWATRVQQQAPSGPQRSA